MKTKYFILAAIVGMTFASCSNDEFIGDNSPTLGQEGDGSIQFAYKVANTTRADHVGADAASLLNKRFIVGGFKTADNGTTFSKVFDNYAVAWVENTAGKTASNTSDWEYAGVTPLSVATSVDNQTIKYWDYNDDGTSTHAWYDFIAYSTYRNDDVTSYASGKIAVSAIDHANLETAAYTLEGDADDLFKCHVADMVRVPKTSYGEEVTLQFRSLSSKVRIALYETVPGYSVKAVKFYTQNVNPSKLGIDPATDAATTETAALIGKFGSKAQYTVFFPSSDSYKAHVTLSSTANNNVQSFGELTANYVGAEHNEAVGTYYLGRSSNAATYAGTSTFYKQVLPNEKSNNGSADYSNVLELAVDYTLVSTDGSGEVINVYGATAYVPAAFTQWMPNYAYTYIFKISDATNGWTSKTSTDPKGLFPITFDAMVIDSEENTQKTITTVASPSITTYQKGHDITKNEYSAATGDIYVQVIENGTLKSDLGTNGHLYTVTVPGKTYATQPADYNTTNNVYYTDAALTTPATAAFSTLTTYYKASTEVDVIEALNVIESGSTGRNGVTLTAASPSPATTTTVPGENGENITVASGTAAVFTPAKGVYAYVYDTQTWNGIAVSLTNASHSGYPTGYYTDAACTTPATGSWVEDTSEGTYYVKEGYIYTAVTQTSSKPTDWDTAGVWWKDPDGTIAAGTWDAANEGVEFYKKYAVNGQIYAVKVIKVVD